MLEALLGRALLVPLAESGQHRVESCVASRRALRAPFAVAPRRDAGVARHQHVGDLAALGGHLGALRLDHDSLRIAARNFAHQAGTYRRPAALRLDQGARKASFARLGSRRLSEERRHAYGCYLAAFGG